MANGGTGMLSAGTLAAATPEVARRTWPQWLGLGVALIAVAVTAVVWDTAGARLLLGALGVFLAVRGGTVIREARSMSGDLAGRARALGITALVGGALASGAAAAGLGAWVLLVAVPVALLAAAVALLARGPVARRGGLALLVWSLLVTGLLVATGLGQGWARAADVATVVTALAVAVLGVPLVVGGVNLRAVAARPVPARPAGCGGCACGAGGCGA